MRGSSQFTAVPKLIVPNYWFGCDIFRKLFIKAINQVKHNLKIMMYDVLAAQQKRKKKRKNVRSTHCL